MRRAFTLVELLVTMAVVALLVALLLPALAGVRRASKNSGCLSNLHQIAVSVQVYAAQHKNVYPGDWLTEPAEPYGFDPGEAGRVSICPSDPAHGPVSYGLISPIGDLRCLTPAAECFGTSTVAVAYDQGPWHPHYNTGYLDGHAARFH